MKTTPLQARFLRRIADFRPFRELVELLPDVAFFLKDRRGRFILQNRRSLDFCRVATEEETVGKTDHDFYPADRAALYVAGDEQVMSTGKPIINAVAPAPEEAGADLLIVYSKVAVRDRQGRVIGVAGIHREVDGLRLPPKRFGRLSQALKVMHQRYAEPLTTVELARVAGISRSQFDRNFLRVFGQSPREYLLRVRVNAACRLLADPERKTTDIALETGFYDHSHFSRTFRRIMGLPPKTYRQQHKF